MVLRGLSSTKKWDHLSQYGGFHRYDRFTRSLVEKFKVKYLEDGKVTFALLIMKCGFLYH